MSQFRGVSVWAVVKHALAAKLKRVFVVGVDKNGELYAAGSGATADHKADIAAFQRNLRTGVYDTRTKQPKAA